MTLKNFESQFSKRILDQGWMDYEGGAVQDIEYQGKDVAAKVEQGQKIYTVQVQDEVGELVASCTCGKGLCRHIAAVLYCMEEDLATDEAELRALEEVLQTRTKEQLIQALLSAARLHPGLLTHVRMCVTPTGEELLAYCRNIIRAEIKAQMMDATVDKTAFVELDMRQVDFAAALEGADAVLDMAEALCIATRYKDSVALCILTMQEMAYLRDTVPEAKDLADELLEDALETLETTLQLMLDSCEDAQVIAQVWDYLFTKLQNTSSQAWSVWGPYVLVGTLSLCDDRDTQAAGQRADKLDQFLAELSESDDSRLLEEFFPDGIAFTRASLQQKMAKGPQGRMGEIIQLPQKTRKQDATFSPGAPGKVLSLFKEDVPACATDPEDALPELMRQELAQRFVECVRDMAAMANKCPDYQEICDMLTGFAEQVGKEVCADLIRELQQEYPNKRAFQELLVSCARQIADM